MDGRGDRSERDSGPFEIQRDNRAGQVRVSGCPTNFQHFTRKKTPGLHPLLPGKLEIN